MESLIILSLGLTAFLVHFMLRIVDTFIGQDGGLYRIYRI